MSKKTPIIRCVLVLAGMWNLAVAADDSPSGGSGVRHPGAQAPKEGTVSKKSEPIHPPPAGHGASALGPGIHAKSSGAAAVGGLAKSSAKHSAAVINGNSTRTNP